MKNSGTRWGLGIAILLFIVIFLPLLAVLLNAFLPGIFFGNIHFQGFGLLGEIFQRPLWRQSLLNSLWLGLGTALLGTVLGTCLAMMRARWQYATGRLLDAGVWLLLITPSFMLAQGWVLFGGADGIASRLLGMEWLTSFLFQPVGLMVIMALSKFPLAYLAVLASAEWSVSHYGHAARMNGAGPWTVWRTVELPLAVPSIIAGATLVFIDTVGDFGLPAALSTVYRFPTLTYSIYSAIYQSPVRFDMAGVLAFYLVVLLSLAMFILMMSLRKSRFDFLSAKATKSVKTKPQKSYLINAITMVSIAISIGIPLGSSLCVSIMKRIGEGFTLPNLTMDHYLSLFSKAAADHTQLNFIEGMVHSLAIAALAAVLSIIIGFIVAYVLTFTESKMKGGLQLFSIVSLAVPGIVMGIGYIFVWNQKWLEYLHLHLYGTPALLVIAVIAGAIPYAVRVQLGSFGTISPSVLNAAAVQGAGTVDRMVHIVLPLVRRSLLLAMLAAFGTSVFDLALASMLQPANYVLMPIVIDQAFEFGRYGYATAATVLSGMTLLLLILLIQFAGESMFRWSDNRRSKRTEMTIPTENQRITHGGSSYEFDS
ncbi:iron ABC transporter permease [Paenibacillus sp. JNUCC31]|uniref:ABC transporter permease n=1 Tax=Paenibacillus sp. JNUCC-31 TaxID=2777983 RepID=UPI0017809455|nr:iron ABC transporter permease [Paenibacillus sp. JNUCC-31]QOS79140.1 iron ABC transporter permease [Paenibacillus sp. JNUCC-31]